MKPSIRTLGEILYSPSQYVIPVFQRNYRWERPQWEKFWESLVEIRQPEKTGNHFMGFLVFVPGLAQPGQNIRFHLIDGQQRLTTSSLLLVALRNVARRLGQGELAKEIHDYLLVHPLKKGEAHYRLLPKAHDQAAWLALVDAKSPIPGRMANALAYFEQRVAGLADDADDELRTLFDVVCQRLEFMCATLESENAYNIFKGLNSTGIPLGPSDLIRNFVFMHVKPDEQDAFDREHWAPLEALFGDAGGRLDEAAFSRFFRDVLMSDGRYVQPKDTFATFEARHEATGFVPAELADALLADARRYAVISGQENDADAGVTHALQGLNLLESSTTYPLLLALVRRRDEGVIDSAALARCIQMLRGFILRRFVCGESSRGYGQMFVRALARDAGDPVAVLEQYLLERGWPDDHRFVEAFVQFPLYQRGYAREVLETLERARGHKEQADLGAAQIEHILPQTLRAEWVQALGQDAERVHAEWLHRPGNLTLSAYNQEVGNQPFPVKRERFRQSNIVLTREIADAPAWDAEVIRARGMALGKAAAAIWAGPKDPYVPAVASGVVPSAPRHEVRLKFWSGLAEYLAEADSAIPRLEPRQFRNIRLPSGIRHIGVEARHMVRPGEVAVDVYFWRAASAAVWERLKDDPAEANAAINDVWGFELLAEDGRNLPRMSVSRAVDSDDESEWPALYAWFSQKLSLLYQHVLPVLRDEMGATDPNGTGHDGGDESRLSETQMRQVRFWAALGDDVRARSGTLRPQKPLPQYWTNYAVGRAGFSITPTFNARDGRIGVELVIGGLKAKARFAALREQQQVIDAGLGFPVEWQEMPDQIMSRIGCWRAECPLEDESRWPDYVDWMAERVIGMDGVFRPILKQVS